MWYTELVHESFTCASGVRLARNRSLAWSGRPTNQPTISTFVRLLNNAATSELLPAPCASVSAHAGKLASGALLIDCIKDDSYRDYTAGCGDDSTYALQYSDDTGGPYPVDEAFEPTGCAGGHKVCSKSCNLVAETALQAPKPQMYIDDYGAGSYGVYWIIYGYGTTQMGPFCDPPTDSCWDDINSYSEIGQSVEACGYCNP